MNNPVALTIQTPTPLLPERPDHISHGCLLDTNSQILTYCNSPECMRPLCLACLPHHCMMHFQNGTQPLLLDFKNVKENCNEKLNKAANSLNDMLLSVKKDQDLIPGNWGYHDIEAEKIRRSKEYLINYIEKYYQELQDHYLLASKPLETRLERLLDDINNLKGKLKDDNCSEILKEIYARDFEKEIFELKANFPGKTITLNDKPVWICRNNIKVEVDYSRLYSVIKEELQKYSYIISSHNQDLKDTKMSVVSKVSNYKVPSSPFDDFKTSTQKNFTYEQRTFTSRPITVSKASISRRLTHETPILPRGLDVKGYVESFRNGLITIPKQTNTPQPSENVQVKGSLTKNKSDQFFQGEDNTLKGNFNSQVKLTPIPEGGVETQRGALEKNLAMLPELVLENMNPSSLRLQRDNLPNDSRKEFIYAQLGSVQFTPKMRIESCDKSVKNYSSVKKKLLEKKTLQDENKENTPCADSDFASIRKKRVIEDSVENLGPVESFGKKMKVIDIQFQREMMSLKKGNEDNKSIKSSNKRIALREIKNSAHNKDYTIEEFEKITWTAKNKGSGEKSPFKVVDITPIKGILNFDRRENLFITPADLRSQQLEDSVCRLFAGDGNVEQIDVRKMSLSVIGEEEVQIERTQMRISFSDEKIKEVKQSPENIDKKTKRSNNEENKKAPDVIEIEETKDEPVKKKKQGFLQEIIEIIDEEIPEQIPEVKPGKLEEKFISFEFPKKQKLNLLPNGELHELFEDDIIFMTDKNNAMIQPPKSSSNKMELEKEEIKLEEKKENNKNYQAQSVPKLDILEKVVKEEIQKEKCENKDNNEKEKANQEEVTKTPIRKNKHILSKMMEENDDIFNKAMEEENLLDMKSVCDFLTPSCLSPISQFDGSTTPRYCFFDNQEEIEKVTPFDLFDVKSSDFSVNAEDYFNPSCKSRFLHFFQWRSKNLHIISLDNLKKLRGEAKFETIPLSIDFEIPDYHNSLIIPDGEIYLTGGQDPKDLNKKFREVYAVSFAKKTLIKKSSMITARDSHALCYFKGHLYVIGGITINSQGKKTVTNKCEKYSIKDNKWQEIADLTLPVCNHSAAVFQNKYIFCFGGRLLPNKLSNNILRYSLDKDEWLKIEVRPQIQTQNKLSLTSQATCYQINEGQIFIFGGYQADRNISSQSFLFEYCAASNDVELKPKSSLKEDMEENKSFLNLSSKENERKKGSGKRPPRKKEGGITGKKDICIIKGLNKKNLPHAAPFWDKQVIVDKGKIYCLQNVTMPNDPKLSYSTTRRILVFDGEKWTSLN